MAPDLARCAMTVCMVPRAKASAEVLERRRTAVEMGLTLSHWPQKFDPKRSGIQAGRILRSVMRSRSSLMPSAACCRVWCTPRAGVWQSQYAGSRAISVGDQWL